MKTVFHYGQDSDRFLREFENKRADYALHEVAELPEEDLKALLLLFRQENRTFAEPAETAV